MEATTERIMALLWFGAGMMEARQEGRQFIAALERQANLFDGRELEIGLALERMAHDDC